MATVSILLKKDYKSKDETYPIIIRLKSGIKTKAINTGYKVSDKQFKNNQVVKHEDADIINSVINDKLYKAKKYFADCAINGRIVNLDNVFKENVAANLLTYIEHRAAQYKDKGQMYFMRLERLVIELKECFGQLFFDDVNADTLRDYQNYLLKKNGSNTVAKKIKTLTQLFQNAIDEGVYIGANPLKSFKVKTIPVKKEKLTPQEITAIENLDLSGQINDARNLFLFAYYAKGIRFENCIFLRRQDIRDGRVYITTNKGNKHISILINSKLKNILEQYKGKDFVFPFVKEAPANAFEYRNVKGTANSMVNRFLKVVAGLAEIKKHLTFHLSRHALAHNLKKSGANINSIKDILGHSSTRTTEIYLSSLDDEQLDDDMKKLFGE